MNLINFYKSKSYEDKIFIKKTKNKTKFSLH